MAFADHGGRPSSGLSLSYAFATGTALPSGGGLTLIVRCDQSSEDKRGAEENLVAGCGEGIRGRETAMVDPWALPRGVVCPPLSWVFGIPAQSGEMMSLGPS